MDDPRLTAGGLAGLEALPPLAMLSLSLLRGEDDVPDAAAADARMAEVLAAFRPPTGLALMMPTGTTGPRTLAALEKFDTLEALQLDGAGPAFCDDDLLALLARLPSLTDLSLLNQAFPNPAPPDTLPVFSARGLAGFSGRASFTRLALCVGPDVDDAAAARLAKDNPALTALALTSASGVGDAAMAAFAKLDKLYMLYLDGAGNVTDAGLAALVEGAPALRLLMLRGTAITPAGRRAFAAHRAGASSTRHSPPSIGGGEWWAEAADSCRRCQLSSVKI